MARAARPVTTVPTGGEGGGPADVVLGHDSLDVSSDGHLDL